MDYKSIDYKVVDMPNTKTFSRVGKTTGRIQFNKRFVSLLTPDEKLTQVIWCCEKRKDHNRLDEDVDIEVYVICKELGLTESLLSVMEKQQRFTDKKSYIKRLNQMKQLVKNK